MHRPEPSVRDRGGRTLLVAASLVVVIAGLRAAASVILPFLIALFLAMVSLPLFNWLRHKRMPAPLAVVVTLLIVFSLVFGFGALVGGSISGFTEAAPKYRERLETMAVEALAWLESHGLAVPEQLTQEVLQPGRVMDLATTALRGIASVLSNLLLVSLTVVFIFMEAAGFPEKLRVAFGEAVAVERFEKIRHDINRYLGIKTLISLATGTLIGSSLAIIGVDFPVLWGALAFILNYIPNLGSIIAALPPTLLAAVQLGPGYALAVALVFVAVNLVLGSFIEPYLMGRRLGLSTLVIFLSLLFWGWVWGPVGMLLSVPITMITKIMLENSRDFRWVATLLDAGGRLGDPSPPRGGTPPP